MQWVHIRKRAAEKMAVVRQGITYTKQSADMLIPLLLHMLWYVDQRDDLQQIFFFIHVQAFLITTSIDCVFRAKDSSSTKTTPWKMCKLCWQIICLILKNKQQKSPCQLTQHVFSKIVFLRNGNKVKTRGVLWYHKVAKFILVPFSALKHRTIFHTVCCQYYKKKKKFSLWRWTSGVKVSMQRFTSGHAPEELEVQASFGQEELVVLLEPHLAHGRVLEEMRYSLWGSR